MKYVKVVCLMAVVFATVAGAAPVFDVQTITPVWKWDPGTPPPASIRLTAPAPSTINAWWGIPWVDGVRRPDLQNDQYQSGYGFAGLPALGVAPGAPFVLGTFTHTNRPVEDWITLIGLELTLGIEVPGDGLPTGSTSSYTVTYWLQHQETGNTGPGCCDDNVVPLNTMDPLATISYGGTTYGFRILGFSTGAGPMLDFLSTPENDAKTFGLYGQFYEVPEPGTFALIAIGTSALLLLRRRRS